MQNEYIKQLSLRDHRSLVKNTILSSSTHLDFEYMLGLLEGFPVNIPLNESGETALMIAAKLGKLAIMNLLLKRGADPNIVDTSGNSAVIHSIKSLKPVALEAIRLLHENGAVLSYLNNEGKRPADYIEGFRSKNMDEYEDLLENYEEFTSRYCLKVSLYYAFKLNKINLI